MKTIKALFCLGIILLFCSCETTIHHEELDEKYHGTNVVIFTIDSCEYIKVGTGNSTWGSHKGNCKYCQARRKK